MGLPRSTYYDPPPVQADDGEIVAAILRSAMSLRPMAIAALAPSFAIEDWLLTPRKSVA